MNVFNEIIHLKEKKRGALHNIDQINEFKSILRDLNVYDLRFLGNTFTWIQGNFQRVIEECLNRVLTLSW